MEEERKQLYVELHDRMYSIVPYYLARFTTRTLIEIPLAIAYSLPIYWISGMQADGTRFFSFMVFVYSAFVLARSLGFAISAWITDLRDALSAANIIFNVFLIPTAFFVHIYLPTDWLTWLEWVCFLLRFPMEGMLQYEYEGLTFTCDTPPCPISDESDALAALYMQSADYWLSLGIIFLVNFITVSLGIAGLYFVDQKPVRWRK